MSSTLVVPRPIVLIGLMGVGKTCIGQRLAERLELPFVDSDTEIEAAAGCTVEDIFAIYGEPAFRDVERRVIARLLSGPVQVIATGGGAFMDAETRRLVKERAISIWLRVELDILVARVGRRQNRPLLKKGDPREVLSRLMTERDPHYATADIVVEGNREPPEATVGRVMARLVEHLAPARPAATGAVS